MDAVLLAEAQRLLGQLDPKTREILDLRLRDMDQNAIADMVGMTQGAVSKRLAKVRLVMPHLPSRLSNGRHRPQRASA